MNIYTSNDWVSIVLDCGNTKAFAIYNQTLVEDENGDIEAVRGLKNTNLKQQVDSFAGEGFFDNNIKGILADDS